MTYGRTLVLAILLLGCAAASASQPAPDKNPQSASGLNQPIGGGKPISTIVIKRCPEGRELVIRVDGRYGCAKDIVPPND